MATKTYKDIQKAFRQKLAPKTIHIGGTVNLSMRKFKQRLDVTHAEITKYKADAWKLAKKESAK